MALKELNDPVMAHDYFLAIHNQSDQALQLHANDLVLVDQQYQEYAAGHLKTYCTRNQCVHQFA